MKATVMHRGYDVRVETVPDPRIVEPTDAVVRITRSCICGSDLHFYHNDGALPEPRPMGHEYIGVVEDVGHEVTTLRKGDFVVAPWAYQDNTCVHCRAGVQTSCLHGGFYGQGGVGGAQAEAIRTPLADGSLVKVPGTVDPALYPSLLALSDVYLTGHHAALTGGVTTGSTVTVIGDGAVGLSAVLAARQLGAETIVLLGHHKDRTDLGIEFGATHVVAGRGDEAVEETLSLTGGIGSPIVLEAVGFMPAYEQAYKIVRPGGTISRVGVPQYEDAPVGFGSLFGKNVTLTGGPSPVRAYLEAAIPRVLEGAIDPGKVFDRTISIDNVPVGYAEMDDRTTLKALIAF